MLLQSGVQTDAGSDIAALPSSQTLPSPRRLVKLSTAPIWFDVFWWNVAALAGVHVWEAASLLILASFRLYDSWLLRRRWIEPRVEVKDERGRGRVCVCVWEGSGGGGVEPQSLESGWFNIMNHVQLQGQSTLGSG